jgi:hypothetical protein
MCACAPNWAGKECNISLCYDEDQLDNTINGGYNNNRFDNDADGCGEFGTCKDGQCVCALTHTGRHCNVLTCNNGSGCGFDTQGFCVGGTCECLTGWEGIDCTIEAPPSVSASWSTGMLISFVLSIENCFVK